MEKQIKFKHGVSVNGEVQVYKITQYIEGDEVKHEVITGPKSPPDPYKVDDWDVKTQQIIEALYAPEVIEEVQQDIAYYLEKVVLPGFREVFRFDRIFDDLCRVSIRQRFELIENNKIISLKYRRSWIMPGGTFLDKDILSKTLAKKFHTPENIGLYQAAMAKNDKAFESGLKGEAVIK